MISQRDSAIRGYVTGNMGRRVVLWRVDKLPPTSYSPTIETPRNGLEAAGVEFTAAIKKAFRGCEVRTLFSTGDHYFQAYVYMPGDTCCMGYITVAQQYSSLYGDYAPKFSYKVFAHTIRNNRYTDGVEQQSCETVNPKKAVDNAKKYLRRVTHEELTKITSEEYFNARRDQEEKVESELAAATCCLLGVRPSLLSQRFEDMRNSPLLTELFWQVDAGTTNFVSPDVKVKLEEVRRLHKEYTAIMDSRTTDKVMCIQVHEVKIMGEETHEFSTAVISTTRWLRSGDVVDYCRYTEKTLPEDIAGKIAVLTVCGANTAVIGVGYRYDENIFYVVC